MCLVALVGCKSNRDGGSASGVSRGKNDPLFASGQNLIPKQNVPLPDHATGPKGRPDPLMSPTSRKDDKIGYSAGPERFKGVYVPGVGSTPAALTNRLRDGDELKIDDTSGGVTLIPASGTVPAGALEPSAEVTQLYGQLEKLGIKREDYALSRENNQWVFRAARLDVNGLKTQFTGGGATAAEAIQQVLKQLK